MKLCQQLKNKRRICDVFLYVVKGDINDDPCRSYGSTFVKPVTQDYINYSATQESV